LRLHRADGGHRRRRRRLIALPESEIEPAEVAKRLRAAYPARQEPQRPLVVIAEGGALRREGVDGGITAESREFDRLRACASLASAMSCAEAPLLAADRILATSARVQPR